MRTARLSEIACPSGLVGGPFGSSLVSADYQPSGVPVIRGENLNAGKWIGGPFAYVSTEKVSTDLARNTAEAGDVVFTQRGTLGQVALVPMGIADRLVVSQSQMRLRADQGKALPDFVYYACSSPGFLQQIMDRAIATGVPHINLGILGSLEVPLPPLPMQRAIVQVLGALDDKITANAILQTTSRELRATELKALIYGEAVSIALGESTLLLTRGRAPRYTVDGAGVIVLNQKCVRDGVVSIEAARRAEVAREPLVEVGDTLVNSTGQGTLGRVGVWREGLIAFPDSHVSVLRFDPKKVEPWVGAEAVLAAQTSIEAMAEGSTGQTELSRKALAELAIIVPARPFQRALGEKLRNLHLREHQSVLESRRLAELRDTLLPHLMSGRITVREAEKAVEEVL